MNENHYNNIKNILPASKTRRKVNKRNLTPLKKIFFVQNNRQRGLDMKKIIFYFIPIKFFLFNHFFFSWTSRSSGIFYASSHFLLWKNSCQLSRLVRTTSMIYFALQNTCYYFFFFLIASMPAVRSDSSLYN